jgi:hypothetical protein
MMYSLRIARSCHILEYGTISESKAYSSIGSTVLSLAGVSPWVAWACISFSLLSIAFSRAIKALLASTKSFKSSSLFIVVKLASPVRLIPRSQENYLSSANFI